MADIHSLEEIWKTDPMNEHIFSEIVEAIKRKNVIPFIGAGLSVPFYKLWGNFIINASRHTSKNDQKEIQKFVNDNKYEEAAEVLSKSLTPLTYVNAIVEEFKPSKIDNMKLLQSTVTNIPKLFPESIVITTNFDKVLERAYSLENLEFTSVITPDTISEYQWKRVQANREHSLVKIHGDIGSPDRLILSESDYDKAYGKNLDHRYVSKIKSIIGNNTLLFIGCSLNNDRFVKLLGKISGKSSVKYAIMEKTSNYECFKKSLEKNGIMCIWYPHKKHNYVGELLGYIFKLVKSEEIENNKEKVVDLFETLKANYGYSANEMGIYNYPRDISEAALLIIRLAKEGNSKALVNMGLIYEYGFLTNVDVNVSLSCYKEAAALNDTKGLNNYAWMIYNGIGIECPDTQEAKHLFKKSADRNDPRGQLWMGKILIEESKSIGCENKDELVKKANIYFKNAMNKFDKDDPVAQNNIGSMYQRGEGVTKSKKTAKKYLVKAAKGKNISALRNLARDADSIAEACEIYLKAANKNDIFSQIGIGNMYYVEGNKEEASKWFEMALKNGYKQAKELIKNCRND